MREQKNRFYDFGPYRLDPAKRILLKDGVPVQLTPKAFDTLLALVEERGHLLAKDELINRVWPDSFVEEGNLTVTISMLRKALGENRGEHRYIVTIPGKGYSFIADVRELWDESTDLIVEERTRSRVVIDNETIEPKVDTGEGRDKALASILSFRLLKSTKTVAAGFILFIVFAVSVYLLISIKKDDLQAAPRRTSIAILPFKSLSSDAYTEYIGFGVSETLITRLSNIQQIHVRSTSAVQKYTNPARDCFEIGRELKVDVVLDGSIQKVDNKVRVIVRLLRVKDGSSLWAKKFDEDFKNFFAVQDAISEQTARALIPTLSGEQQHLLTRRYTENTEAYELYVMGRYFWNRRTIENMRKGIEFFKQATDKDPQYALAWAGLADSYILLGSSGYDVPPKEMIEKARGAAIRAIEIDNTLAEAYTSLGIINLQYDWNWSEAERELSRALELKPNYQPAQYWYVIYLIAMGRLDEAIEISKEDYSSDPDSLILGMNLARAFYYARHYDQAIQQCSILLDKDPDYFAARFILASAYTQEGAYSSAFAEYQKLMADFPNDLISLAALGTAHAKAGNRSDALRIIAELEAKSSNKYVTSTYTLTIYAYLGDKDKAMDGLEQAYHERSSALINMKVEPTFDGVRSDARFADLLQRVGL